MPDAQTPSIHPVRELLFVDDASRFEIGGTANYPGAVGLAASLQVIHDLGTEAISNHIFGLTSYLIDGLKAAGVHLVTCPEPKHRSGIVTFSVGSSEDNIAPMKKLRERRILTSVRYTSQVGGIRVSCHFFNNVSDLDCLLEGVKECMNKV